MGAETILLSSVDVAFADPAELSDGVSIEQSDAFSVTFRLSRRFGRPASTLPISHTSRQSSKVCENTCKCGEFFIFTSGVKGDKHGVGVILHVSLLSSVTAVQAYSSWQITGGRLTLLGIYCPHEGVDVETRGRFFDELNEATTSYSKAGPVLACGDLHTPLKYRYAEESAFFGPHLFDDGHEVVHECGVENARARAHTHTHTRTHAHTHTQYSASSIHARHCTGVRSEPVLRQAPPRCRRNGTTYFVHTLSVQVCGRAIRRCGFGGQFRQFPKLNTKTGDLKAFAVRERDVAVKSSAGEVRFWTARPRTLLRANAALCTESLP